MYFGKIYISNHWEDMQLGLQTKKLILLLIFKIILLIQKHTIVSMENDEKLTVWNILKKCWFLPHDYSKRNEISKNEWCYLNLPKGYTKNL